MTNEIIVLDSVSKTYRGKQGITPVLANIDLRIQQGEFVVLHGPSGSGKTTLLVLIAGMLRPSQGEIIVDGQKLNGLSAQAKAFFRARNIGFIFQMFHLVPYLSTLENVVLAFAGSNPKEGGKRAESLLHRLEMGAKYDSFSGELSAGEKQRTAIARALINQPSILLADEPTGNLDPDTARLVFSCLSDYKNKGGTVVMASHNDLADGLADRVLELRSGDLA